VKHDIRLNVNGRDVELSVESQRTLLEVLREELALFGAREACGMSVCGACTVLLDDAAVSSCTYFAARADGRRITTVEGLSQGDQLHPVQQAFLEAGAFQCSYCTPGMILATVSLLREAPHATEEDIKDYLAGNLCRCGAYPEILAAIRTLVH
jgi:aerobic-type carbon monoxide dehydrogenase small subunit (CoxS/CutS family)